MSELLVCIPKRLPPQEIVRAASTAIEINPANRPGIEHLAGLMRGFRASRERLAVMTTKYWGAKGVELTVGFLDNPPADLRKRILEHMNAWSKTANVVFRETRGQAEVRIAREAGGQGGYWSYLGTDIRLIDADKPTMNLQEFTMEKPDSEFYRVVRHEAGHTLGFPHEHMRRQLVEKIDRKKAIKYFRELAGWSPAEVDQQVMTPIEEGSLLRTTNADPHSIMCYQIPARITKDGKPIPGGSDIDAEDYTMAAALYPKQATRPRARPAARPATHREPVPA